MSFWNKLLKKAPNISERQTKEIDQNNVPQHVAIIMDGNGRWAKQRRLPRVAGHKEGMQTVKTIALHAKARGVKVLTLYAFSTENWNRPEDEVSFLMKLPIDFFSTFIPQLNENNIRVQTMGFIEKLPEKTREAVLRAEKETVNNDGMILNFALNYGARAEIVTAMNQLLAENVTEVTEQLLSEKLWTNQLGQYPDPDLVIRTSGEQRISNFMLWQIAYSEFFFTPVFWPDFKEEQLDEAIIDYQNRQRRYGGLL